MTEEKKRTALADLSGEYRVGLVIVDDVLGGWTNRDSTVQLSPETRRMVGDLAHYLKNRFRN